MSFIKFFGLAMVLPMAVVTVSLFLVLGRILDVDQGAAVFTFYLSNPIIALSGLVGVGVLVLSRD